LCINVVIGARAAYARYFEWESELKPNEARDAEKTKPKLTRDQLRDNKIFVWFYFLADVIPILTLSHE